MRAQVGKDHRQLDDCAPGTESTRLKGRQWGWRKRLIACGSTRCTASISVARKAFLEARGRASRAVEDLVADGVKIDLLTSRSSDLVDAAKSVLALTQGRPAAHTFKPDRPVTGLPGEATDVVGPDHARDPHRRINRSWREGKDTRKTRSQPARAGGAAPDEAGNVFHYRPRPWSTRHDVLRLCDVAGIINTSTDGDCDTDATEVLRQVMTRAYIKKHTTKPER